ncbi:MAG: DNA cytosine methyltransferase [Finegoldia sp.]|nr:DNA cytosine methyltransferase [Finegoldia sp.]
MIDVQNKTLNGYTFIDLFAGIGGFRLALESFGARCVYSNEWDKYAKETYQLNFSDIPEGDITQVDEKSIPDHDILCAGFPCQAFSISGKQKGFEDSRGTLFFDVARIIKEKKPIVVFLENVKNFAKHDNGNTLKVVKNTMYELGYSFDYAVLNPTKYGVPQKRERIYMISFRNDVEREAFSFPKPFKLEKYVEDFLLPNNETKKYEVYRNDLVLNENANSLENSNRTIRVGTVGKGGQGERIYSPKGIAITLSAYGGGIFAKTGGYLIDGKTRKLHPRECARLMGFPDSFKINPNENQAYKQLGNSVVVDVLQYIVKQIGDALNHEYNEVQQLSII